MTNVSLPDNKLWMIASWLSLKESKPKCSCRCDKSVPETFAEVFSDLLLEALVFLVAIFFVSVVAMLNNFLSHRLPDRGVRGFQDNGTILPETIVLRLAKLRKIDV